MSNPAPHAQTPRFRPPAPVPRKRSEIPSTLAFMRALYRNPLAAWGEPSYEDMWIRTALLGDRTFIVNDPGFIRHVLVDNAQNYRFGTVRQLVLRPILRNGLLTAEGDTWKRTRRAMAHIFAPRHVASFAAAMRSCTERFAERYESGGGHVHDVARDMTDLTFAILSETLFSGGIVADESRFARDVEALLHGMGRIDPFDVLRLPPWVPRFSRIGHGGSLRRFRRMVERTMAARQRLMKSGGPAPNDLLTLLLQMEGPDGLTREEIKDNIITFIGAGHETTARALGWTLYCLASSPPDASYVTEEIDAFMAGPPRPPETWIDHLPRTRAAFEEAMRLYPPAPAITRAAIADDQYGDAVIAAGTNILIMPWTLHRHRVLWDEPDSFMPERFWPENREKIGRFQYLPFGAGPRTCIGAAFALQEAVIALAVLLCRFSFECTSDCRPFPVQKLTTQPDGGLPMTVTRRMAP